MIIVRWFRKGALTYRNTSPDVARALHTDEQRKKGMDFLADFTELAKSHVAHGLDRKKLCEMIGSIGDQSQ